MREIEDTDAAPGAPTLPQSAGEPGGDLARGAVMGRYVVLGKLGAGGMGVVYAAYDPELDRKVAIKLLRPEFGEHGGADARTRLLREAQALAKLSHPSVVAIHDFGMVEERFWLAMEFVEGQTLGAWCQQVDRTGACFHSRTTSSTSCSPPWRSPPATTPLSSSALAVGTPD